MLGKYDPMSMELQELGDSQCFPKPRGMLNFKETSDCSHLNERVEKVSALHVVP